MKNTAMDITDIPFIDIAKYRKFKEEGKIECVWDLDGLHYGSVVVESMFREIVDGPIGIPICERHYTWHCAIMTLVTTDEMPLEEALSMSREECMEELIKRGLLPLKV